MLEVLVTVAGGEQNAVEPDLEDNPREASLFRPEVERPELWEPLDQASLQLVRTLDFAATKSTHFLSSLSAWLGFSVPCNIESPKQCRQNSLAWLRMFGPQKQYLGAPRCHIRRDGKWEGSEPQADCQPVRQTGEKFKGRFHGGAKEEKDHKSPKDIACE